MSQITPRRKQLILELADGYSSAFPFIYKLEFFVRREEMYSYLISNNIKGKKLCEFFFENNNSVIMISKRILTAIDGKQKEQIIAGKDMI